ncbi:MAG TPA: hypothetical protein VIR04_00700, partial [Paralcaligenes sp.]
MMIKKSWRQTLAKSTHYALLACASATFVLASSAASAAENVRLAMSTQSWWPTTVAIAADRLKLFQKEGIHAEITV